MIRTRKKRHRKFAWASSAIVLAVLLLFMIIGPANISYYSQAISGHFRIMCSREPIEKILKTHQLDINARNKLKLALKVREFATRELGLPGNKSYTVYSAIDGRYLGWNVYCTPKFSVEPHTWCFPIAGCVAYRGYFSKEKALDFACTMEEKGFDVFVDPFSAYSTLGWYDDPLLGNHLLLDSIHLAGLIIHELAHQEVYVRGDSRFNEGFAVSVERAGVLRWLKSIDRADQVDQALIMWEQQDRVAAKILTARSRLMDIYRNDPDPGSLAHKKDSVFRELKRDLCNGNCTGIKLPNTDGENIKLNNAYLVPVDLYQSLVPVFRGMLESCGGNLPQFFGKVKALGKLSFEERQRKLEGNKHREDAKKIWY